MARKLLMNSGVLMPVQDGLICWLDGRDGKNGDTIWKDRSGNGNDATLINMVVGNNFGFSGGCVICSKNGGYIKLPNCFYMTTSHSFFVFSETLSASNDFYQRLFTFSDGSNNNSIRFENGSYNGSQIFSINRSFSYTLPSTDVIGIGVQNFAYSLNTNMPSILIKYNNYAIYTSNAIPVISNINNKYCYLNNESEIYKSPRDVKFKTVLLYNRALSEQEIQQNYLYEQSITRG